jgi:hypothetical protein
MVMPRKRSALWMVVAEVVLVALLLAEKMLSKMETDYAITA